MAQEFSTVSVESMAEGLRPDILLRLEDGELFDLPRKMEERQHKRSCEIFEFDQYVGTGRLSVHDHQAIPSGIKI